MKRGFQAISEQIRIRCGVTLALHYPPSNRFMHGQLWSQAIAAATLLIGLTAIPSWADGIIPANDGTGTQVTPTGSDHAITGGTTSADSQNLFHSFTEFNLLTGESATFIT
ncbi:MAG: hypothetical protein AAFO87_14175, partial [Cyanobacteria bacterium J06607_6]